LTVTSLEKQPGPAGLAVLEWSVAAGSLLLGSVLVLAGVNYGMTNVTGVGAGFFPVVAGVLVAVSGALWLLQLAVVRRAGVPVSLDSREHALPIPADATIDDVVHHFETDDELDDDAEFPDRAGLVRVGIIVAAVLAAALVLPIIGYTLTMTLMLAVVLFFVSKRPWWLALVVGVGAALASRLVFEVWLGTALPASSIGLLAGLGL
jgi:Tripartite tricarboxylate transporter TctB family